MKRRRLLNIFIICTTSVQVLQHPDHFSFFSQNLGKQKTDPPPPHYSETRGHSLKMQRTHFILLKTKSSQSNCNIPGGRFKNSTAPCWDSRNHMKSPSTDPSLMFLPFFEGPCHPRSFYRGFDQGHSRYSSSVTGGGGGGLDS